MGKRTATASRKTVDTSRRSALIEVIVKLDGVAWGIDVLAVKRDRPVAPEGGKVDGRLFARYDSHTRVYGAERALVGEFHVVMGTAGVDSPEGKAARARAQYHGPRRMSALTRAVRDAAVLDGSQDRVLIEKRAAWSVDAGRDAAGEPCGAFVLAGTVRLDGEPVDLHVMVDPAEAWVQGDDTVTVTGA